MDESNWYYQFMGDEVGPYSLENLRMLAFDGTLLPEMLVRQEGGQWRTAGAVEDLFIKGLENDREFLNLCLQITEDGKIDRAEMYRLRDWLNSNKAYHQIPSVASLIKLWNRITADKVVDKGEQSQLFEALVDLLPPVHRTAVLRKRKSLVASKSASEILRKPEANTHQNNSNTCSFPGTRNTAYGHSRRCRRCNRQLKTRLVLCYKCAP